MLRTTFRHLAARKVRLLGTGVAVILGVAFMAGTLILTDTIGRTFDTLYADVNAGTDAYVRSSGSVGEGTSGHRGRIAEDVVATVAAVDGVDAAEATVRGYARILDAEGRPLGTTGNGPPAYGGNWITADALNPFTLADGRAPSGRGEVVIDRASARAAGFRVGDRTSVLTSAGRADVEIVGIARFGDADSPGGASFALFDLATAEELVAAPGQIDGVRVAAEAGVGERELAARIAAVAPPGVEVRTGTEITAEDQDSVAESLGFFNTFLLAFALVSLFVGSFIIANTFSILVAQRAQEHALLRAIGASRRQVLAAVLGEALAVGLVAAAVGVAVGVAVAAGLRAALDAMGIDLPAGGLVVTSGTVVTSGLTGVVVSVAAALLPARSAARTAPVAALRGTATGTDGGRRRTLVGLAVAAGGSALMAGGLFAGAGTTAVGLGAALVFLGVATLGPSVARPVTRLLGAPVARLRGLPGTLARENAMRNPRRTAATAAALMVGVGLVGTMTVLASSAKASVDQAIGDAFAGDVVIDSGSSGFGGLSPALARDVAGLPEIDAATGIRATTAEIGGRVEQVHGVDAAAVGRVFDLGAVDGSLGALGSGQIGVARAVADDEGLALGDELAVRFAQTGVRHLEVAAIYEKDDAAGSYLLGLPAYEANVAEQLDVKVFASAAPGATPAEAKAAVAAVALDHPQATVQDRGEFEQAASTHIDEMLNLVYALLALAILIALIGIANTLALSVIERTRELGLLRAVGMSRAQLRAAVRWESVLVALFGTVLGLVVGTGFGWALVRALEPEGITAFVVPAAQLLVIAGLAGLSGVLAAVLPARRAARLDVLQAIAAS